MRLFKPQTHFNVISNLATMELNPLAITSIAFLYNYMLSSQSQYMKEHIKLLNHVKKSFWVSQQTVFVAKVLWKEKKKKRQAIGDTFQSSSPPQL